jgi:hypothetical protein
LAAGQSTSLGECPSASHGGGPSDAHDEDEGGQQGDAEVDEDDDDDNDDADEEAKYDVLGMS